MIKSSKSEDKNQVHIHLLSQIYPKLSGNNDENIYNIMYEQMFSFLNPINIYYFIIFNLTVILIVPPIIPNYVEFDVSTYFNFVSNLPFSIYYGRSLFGTDRLSSDGNIDLYKLIIPQDSSTQSNLFIVHDFLNLSEHTPSSTNHYIQNLLIMCGSIWLSQLFHPLESKNSVKIVDTTMKQGKLKKIVRIASIVAVIAVWGYFAVMGFANILDYFYLFHKLLFTSFKKILDLKITLFILLFYFHIYFYTIMIIFTIQTYKRRKKYVGNQTIDYNWLS